MALRKIAIREKIGDWIYYISSMTFKEVTENVKDPYGELGILEVEADQLEPEERIQRERAEQNVKRIAEYIKAQPERFFNSLVLAVYQGDPQWEEIVIKNNEELYVNAGFLSFSDRDRIFPVDGQHRVNGIREALRMAENPNDYSDESVPVIFIAHRNDDGGMERTRRLFTTLNRYAKIVSITDIVLLDEDDSAAIATRKLYKDLGLFVDDKRLLFIKGKAIPPTNYTAFTSIQTLYECNMELLKYYLDTNARYSLCDTPPKRLKGNSTGVKEYIRFRRSEAEVDEYIALTKAFWMAVESNIEAVNQFVFTNDANVLKTFRSGGGGNILFRPVAQVPFVKAAISLFKECNDWNVVMRTANVLNSQLTGDLWSDIAWDNRSHEMKTAASDKAIIERLFKYVLQPSSLNEREKKRMIDGFKASKRIDDAVSDEGVLTQINAFVVERQV